VENRVRLGASCWDCTGRHQAMTRKQKVVVRK
jgi:hypothetical protein